MTSTLKNVATVPSQEAITECCAKLERARTEIARILVGQRGIVEGLLIGVLTGGHVLLEGVPGLAKTTAVKALAAAVHGSFRRIQFTPDLLPSDITGSLIYNPQEGKFRTKLGPVFANFVLADEINRAPAKVQSALLEAMQEGQVTIGEESHALPQPFLVMATGNPVEQEGTYPLPEAQIDRFMLKLLVDYPTSAEEEVIIERMACSAPTAHAAPCMDVGELLPMRELADAVHFSDELKKYVVRIVAATRVGPAQPEALKPLIRYGASPRATISLTLAGRAHALIQGRGYVLPEDIKAIAPAVLRHRVVPTFEAEAEGINPEMIVEQVLSAVRVP